MAMTKAWTLLKVAGISVAVAIAGAALCAWPVLRRVLTPAVAGTLAVAGTVLCLQTTAPYRVSIRWT